jgi:capsular polysaccharide biosynthesis protein
LLTLHDFLAALRRSFWIPVATIVVCLAIAGIYLGTATKQYTATSEVFVAAGQTTSKTVDQSNLSKFISDRVASYGRLATSDVVTKPVIQDLSLTVTPTDLSHKLSATIPLNTAVIEISAKDKSAAQAAKIANAAAVHLVSAVSDLESTQGTAATSPVKLTVVQSATPPTSPSSPKTTLTIALALVIGIALGIAGVLMRGPGGSRRASHSVPPVAADGGMPPTGSDSLFSSTAGRLTGQP